MLEQHSVHRSLLRPPLLFGVERGLFFLAAIGAVPIVGYGDMSFKAIAFLVVYAVIAYVVCTRLTAMDNALVDLLLQNRTYRDNYDPLPSPSVKGRAPRRFKGKGLPI
jgi:type IV secretory pathway TrbD component